MKYRRVWLNGGTYFFTVNLADRQAAYLTEHIDTLRQVWREVGSKHPFHTVAVCILPNHLHTIWNLPPNDCDYATRWALIKSGFSRKLPKVEEISASREAKRERGIWQRRYWEHVIRDDADLTAHIHYIHYNPVKHGFVQDANEWPYSSLPKFLKQGVVDADWQNNFDA